MPFIPPSIVALPKHQSILISFFAGYNFIETPDEGHFQDVLIMIASQIFEMSVVWMIVSN